ncbi:MAG: DUF6029 family protein [Flavobacteriales bacterium]
MKNFFTFHLILFTQSILFSQLTLGLESNSQWYVDDHKIILSKEDAQDRLRTNTYLKADYSIGNFDFITQLEIYESKSLLNYSPDLKGVDLGIIQAKYQNYKGNLEITAGHFYEQFGNGLILRSWEDRQIGINNALLGARLKYSPTKGVNTIFLGGKQRVGMGFNLAEGTLYGVDIETNLSTLSSWEHTDLSVGFSYIGKYENQVEEYPSLPKIVNLFSSRVNFSSGNFYSGAEYVYKSKDALVAYNIINPESQHKGNALLLNFGYSKKGLGMDVNLRRLENMSLYSESALGGNIYNTGIVNYLPALTKQYDYALQNIYIYQSQPNLSFDPLQKSGEIGGQFDLFYKIKKGSLIGGKYGIDLSLNGSYWAGLDSEFDILKKSYHAEFLSFGEKYYQDLGLEIKKKWSNKWSSIFSYLNQFYNKRYIEETIGEVNTNIAVAETTYKIDRKKSIRVDLQHLWADSDTKNWLGGTIEFNLNPNFSIYAHDIYNYGHNNELKRLHYYNFGSNFTKGSTRIGTQYGRQRGGLLCVGGVCRIMSQSSALTLHISTRF